ncbi:hypothetical protein M3I53_37775 [Paraburkholderia sp. CNPSo 3272]|uniref:hypothetical protein n=1 Tax=Paraburkholderia sp. CNPSo 3272 TaxID=2940931 RepID=UPI0020B7524B|nr:hypothetical protein [Paraburkholderia sp. CNPSo 3272]MCP3728763.1 hypothetical protein [Paraburkholderia sp. CNPSo 3272]
MKNAVLVSVLCAAALLQNGCEDDRGVASATAVALSSSSNPNEPIAVGAAAHKTNVPLDPPASLVPPFDENPPPAESHPPSAGCRITRVTPWYEEQRLFSVLPGNSMPFADQILGASGFAHFGSDFSKQLCGADAKRFSGGAEHVVKIAGEGLWKAAVDRVQGRSVSGAQPRSDDRMLCWARS